MNFQRILWQGIHVCAVDYCHHCECQYASDLPYGQALYTPYQINLKNYSIHGSVDALSWFGQPLACSLAAPQQREVSLERHKRNTLIKKRAKVLNCLDYIYGHSLLKLFNVTAELRSLEPDEALIVILQPSLMWLAPPDVDEVWTVDLPFSPAAQLFYPNLNETISTWLEDYGEVRLCPAYSHPNDIDILQLTGVRPHSFEESSFRITYIWRDRRGWADRSLPSRYAKKLGLKQVPSLLEKNRVLYLFSKLKKDFPKAVFTLAGLGREGHFPAWIEDARQTENDRASEQRSCNIYAESRLVVGPHGSNMLLPTAHAGMAIILMPEERWGNLAQDTVVRPTKPDDPRLTLWRYRYLADSTSPKTLAIIARLMLRHFAEAITQFATASLCEQGHSPETTSLSREGQITAISDVSDSSDSGAAG